MTLPKRVRPPRWKHLRERLAEAQNHRCAYCFRRFGEWGKRSAATIDEVVARHRGGKRSYWNCVAACQTCNSKRGHGDALQFAARALFRFHDPRLTLRQKWRMWLRQEGPHPIRGRPPDPILTARW